MELKKYKLGELLCRIENGAVVKQNKGATGIPITRIETLSKGVFNRDKLGYADIDDPTQYENYILEDNDLLMSHINSKEFVGRTVIYKKQGNECIIHGMNLLRIKTNARLLDSEFAYYFFQTDTIKRYLYNLRKDAIGQSSIAISDIKNMIVSVPNISVQKEIAFALRSYDCKIALNRAINQNLEKMIADTMDYMFLSNKHLMQKRLVSDIAVIKAGGDCPTEWSKCKTDEFKVPIYSNGTDNEGLYGYAKESVISNRSITVAARGTIGYCVLREGGYTPIIRLLAVTPNDIGGDVYLHQIFSRIKFKKDGSIQQQLTVPSLASIEIPYPNASELMCFAQKTFPIIDKIKQNKQQIVELAKQRDELLPLLMNGQISPLNCD